MKKIHYNIVQIEDLKVYFPVRRELFGLTFGKQQFLKAVDGVTLNIKPGEIWGLVGESGSGKTTLGKTLTMLIKPTSGNVFFEKLNLNGLEKKQIKKVRKEIQMIFQDPFSSLNPSKTVFAILGGVLKTHGLDKKYDKTERIEELLALVGLSSYFTGNYPHELSGGQRQRVAIARALAVEPRFVVADETVSSLDLSIQAQIINLFVDLHEKLQLTILYITHDLKVAKHISSHIAVMYYGRIIEVASKDELFRNPLHPYTNVLLKAIPKMDPENRKTYREQTIIKPPSLIDALPGCRYIKYCSESISRCREPQLLMDVNESHKVACHRFV